MTLYFFEYIYCTLVDVNDFMCVFVGCHLQQDQLQGGGHGPSSSWYVSQDTELVTSLVTSVHICRTFKILNNIHQFG